MKSIKNTLRNIFEKTKKIISYFKLYGFKQFIRKTLRRIKLTINKPIVINGYFQNIIINHSKANKEYSQINKIKEKIDVVVTIYNAYDKVVRCINSVLENTENIRLILINDKSTDTRIEKYLHTLSDSNADMDKNIEIIIINNDINLGYTKTVNKAITYTENHFVLLNSDTEVPPYWHHRLFKPIIENEKITASVTPLSNSADICSFPNFCKSQDIFKSLDVNTIDKYFAEYGSEQPIETPVGVGFCMAFNKYIFSEVGYFDEENFPIGYGEEYDWSYRALEKGYKNVITTNLFVYHKHGSSFGKKRDELLQKSNIKLMNKHKRFFSDFDKFIENDPLKNIRDTLGIIIDLKTLNKRDKLIFNTKNNGAERIIQKLIKTIARKKYEYDENNIHIFVKNKNGDILQIKYMSNFIERIIYIQKNILMEYF